MVGLEDTMIMGRTTSKKACIPASGRASKKYPVSL